MAGTEFSEIYDLFMMLQTDYRLTALYTSSQANFETYLEPWLLFSIVEFDVCGQSLAYSSTTFTETLTLENKTILSQIMIKYWLMQEIQNILQMDNLIQDHDFKVFAQANNLKSKQDYYNIKCEEISKILTSYGYKYNSWAEWKDQNFDGS